MQISTTSATPACPAWHCRRTSWRIRLQFVASGILTTRWRNQSTVEKTVYTKALRRRSVLRRAFFVSVDFYSSQIVRHTVFFPVACRSYSTKLQAHRPYECCKCLYQSRKLFSSFGSYISLTFAIQHLIRKLQKSRLKCGIINLQPCKTP